MPPTHKLTLKKAAVGQWNKQLGADFKDLFKSLGKAAATGLIIYKTGGAAAPALKTALASSLADALGALKPAKDAHQLAWRLIYAALWRALSDLLEDYRETLRQARLFAAFREQGPRLPSPPTTTLDDEPLGPGRPRRRVAR